MGVGLALRYIMFLLLPNPFPAALCLFKLQTQFLHDQHFRHCRRIALAGVEDPCTYYGLEDLSSMVYSRDIQEVKMLYLSCFL